jgi:hypothetical protein
MEFTNRQMANAFKSIGFSKSEMQMTRMGITYKHPESRALFTFAKAQTGGISISAPGEDKIWSAPIGVTQEKFDQWIDEGIAFPWNPNDAGQEIGLREILLCVARAFSQMHEVLAVDPWKTGTFRGRGEG